MSPLTLTVLLSPAAEPPLPPTAVITRARHRIATDEAARTNLPAPTGTPAAEPPPPPAAVRTGDAARQG